MITIRDEQMRVFEAAWPRDFEKRMLEMLLSKVDRSARYFCQAIKAHSRGTNAPSRCGTTRAV
jgi:hypothetical protein